MINKAHKTDVSTAFDSRDLWIKSTISSVLIEVRSD